MTREEYNLPLTKESYEHMRPKADGILISKTRYLIPEKMDSPLNWMYLMLLMKDSISQKWNFLLKNRRSVIIHPYGLAKMLRTPVNIITVV